MILENRMYLTPQTNTIPMKYLLSYFNKKAVCQNSEEIINFVESLNFEINKHCQKKIDSLLKGGNVRYLHPVGIGCNYILIETLEGSSIEEHIALQKEIAEKQDKESLDRLMNEIHSVKKGLYDCRLPFSYLNEYNMKDKADIAYYKIEAESIYDAYIKCCHSVQEKYKSKIGLHIPHINEGLFDAVYIE